MALRVLLADESSTIKKVMQLALQDFGVEVKAVPVGLDVLQVARSFRPDVVFADVLLAKKSGYDVAHELKSNTETSEIPVILMWSSFMEFDQARADQAGASAKLEKPFDADHLRALVKDLVPRLQENKIANYLSFPDLPEFVEPMPPPPPPQAGGKTSLNQSPGSSVWPEPPADAPMMALSTPGDLEEIDEFQQVPLPGSRKNSVVDSGSRKEEWAQESLEQFRVSTNSFALGADPSEDLSQAPVAQWGRDGDIKLEDLDELTPAPFGVMPAKPIEKLQKHSAAIPTLDPLRAEEILREQVREVIQDIAWKIIPDIAERVVREEIQKLLKDAERI